MNDRIVDEMRRIRNAHASQWLRFFERRFTLLHDSEELLAIWQALVKSLAIS